MVQAPVSPNAASGNPLTSEELRKIHAYWRACNYLAAGMIYLREILCSKNLSSQNT